MDLSLASTEFVQPQIPMWGQTPIPNKKEREVLVRMNELLFFALGMIIGGLSIANYMQYQKIKELKKSINNQEVQCEIKRKTNRVSYHL